MLIVLVLSINRRVNYLKAEALTYTIQQIENTNTFLWNVRLSVYYYGFSKQSYEHIW